jgi:alpha-tubulin suppressor-like RCC1 family protein
MANTTGTYTTGLVDGVLGLDLGRFLIEQAYVTGVASFLTPAYFAPLAEKSGFAFVSGVTTYNLDDIYVRTDYWREGNLLLWGKNTWGHLGTNDRNPTSSPVQTVSGGITWKSASCGYSHTAGIKSDGSLWLWGYNSSGQLGDNTNTHRSSPIQTISNVNTWWQVSCGGFHTSAIKNNGSLWLWGLGSSGQLGDNTTVSKSSPVQTIAGGTTWKQVSCGYHFVAAIKSDNTLWCWGLNDFGQLGTNNVTSVSSPVQTVSGGTSWKQVACQGKIVLNPHAAAIKTDNSLWVWGNNSYGQLGTNDQTHRSSPIQTVSATKDWKWVAVGHQRTVAIKTDGSLWCWGRNSYGQLGDNTVTNRSSPVQTISGGNTWKVISCTRNSTHAIKTDGTLWGWGSNNNGQLGDLTIVRKSSPVQTAIGGTAWRQVAGGYSHILALDFNDQPASIIVPAPPPSTPSCWVARLVYGSKNPQWIVFREWLLNESPIWFRNTYLKYGEAFAKYIENKPFIKFAIRNFMNAIIKNKKFPASYLQQELRKFEKL